MAGQTIEFAITGDSSSAQRAFKQSADSALLASRAAKQLADQLGIQSKSAVASASATETLAKTDKTLRDAQIELAVASGKLTRAQADQIIATKAAQEALDKEGRSAETAAVKTALAGDAAKKAGRDAQDAGGGFGLLASPMGAAIGAGVALSPILLTLGAGLGGLAAAAYSTTKNTGEMGRILAPLKSEFTQFSASLQPEVLGVFNSGVHLASGLLRDLQPVSAATGKALEGVLGQVDAEFRSGEWQSFFSWMAANAGPDMRLLGNLVVDLTKDLPGLMEGLQPVAVALLTVSDDALKATHGMESLIGASIKWSQQHGGTGWDKIQEFLQWGETHIPAGNKTVLDLITSTGQASVTMSAQVASATENVSTNLGTLEAKYGLSAAQAQALVKAAGQTDKALAASGSSAAGAVKAIENYANASLAGTSPTKQLAADIQTLDNNTLGATLQLDAFNDAWNILVGNSVGDQQAVLATSQAFSTFAAQVKKSGAGTLQAQSDFLSYITSVGQGLQTLEKNGASVRQINSYYETQITRLSSLHNLTPAQRKDVEGLTRDYNVWANSTAGLNKQTLTAAGIIKNQFTANLKSLGEYSPKVNTDVNNFANAVLKTGNQSHATQADRARLIKDLENAGLSAHSATKLVDGLQKKIDGMHGKKVTVGVNATGSGGVKVTASGIASRLFHLVHQFAGGGLVTAGTGPTADDVPALVSRGETVVSAAHSKKLAGAFKAVGVPGYASGGTPAGMADFVGAQEKGIIGGWAKSEVSQMLAGMVQQYANQAAASFAGGPAASGSALAAQKFARSMLSAYGWGAGQWPALLSLWNRESGWNANAVNPTSGAYGIPQALGHGHPFNLGDYANQVRWGLAYIFARYGSPSAAWAHEQAAGWYGSGLDAIVSKPTLIGVGERGKEHVQVTPVTPGRGTGAQNVTVVLENHGVIGSQAELDNWALNTVNRLAKTGQLTYVLQHSPSAK